METLICFFVMNFTLTFLLVGLVGSGFSLMRKQRPWSSAAITESLLSYFVLCSIGLSFFYNSIVHTVFGDIAASFIGWANSPFQREVGFASLGFAVIGFLAFRGSFEVRLAAIAGSACFQWGAAGGHVYEMVTTGNFAPGNAGIMFYSDLLLPLIGFVLLWFAHPRHCAESRSMAGG